MILSILITCGVVEILTGVFIIYIPYIDMNWIIPGIVIMNWLVLGLIPILSVTADKYINNITNVKFFLFELLTTVITTIVLLNGTCLKEFSLLLISLGWLKSIISLITSNNQKIKGSDYVCQL